MAAVTLSRDLGSDDDVRRLAHSIHDLHAMDGSDEDSK